VDAEKIATIAIGSLPELLGAAAALIALCKSSGATDEQIQKLIGPASRDAIKDIAETQNKDEADELAIFASAKSDDVSSDPTSSGGNPPPDGSLSMRA
jgi:hypothetical protein